jgi:uncharacterized protein involved in oxidation of intracellular sulfur
MKILLLLNDAPYGVERTYNALRTAGALAKREGVELKLFLVGDAAAAAKSGQKVPAGYYNTEVMLAGPLRHGAAVGVCGTCMDARGIRDTDLVPGSRRSTLEEMADWILWADKVIVF